MIDITKKRYERKGSCIRCGSCCTVCEHLKREGDSASCLIYGNKPEGCSLFPELPPILFQKCGFYFIDLWENGREVRPGGGV